MNEIMAYLITVIAIFSISALCAMTRKGFSTDIFLASVVIGICVLIWKEMLPFYTITLCAIIIIGILFSSTSKTSMDSDNNE